MSKKRSLLLPLVALLIFSCQFAFSSLAAETKIDLQSPAFKNGQTIPKQYTADGKDISPPLDWGAVPAQTKSLALICNDPDAPLGTWVHWVVYDMPASTTKLNEGIPTELRLIDGTRQGTNSFRKTGYGGPSPPPGKAHRYFFKLYVLNTVLNLEPGVDAKDIEQVMQGHILATGQLMGTYGR